MFDPTAYPYVNTPYVDGTGAVTAADFYNPTMDSLARLFGAACGLSTSISTEEFDRYLPVANAVAAGGNFGRQLLIDNVIPSANIKASAVAALAVGDCGVWLAQSLGGAVATLFVAFDAECYVGAHDFIWLARVRIAGKARLDTLANEGIVIGMGNNGAVPNFQAGNDTANWKYQVGGVIADSGVAVADGTWYTLVIARSSGVLTFYIGTGTAAPVAVSAPAAYATSIRASRYVKFNDTGATTNAGDGLYFDTFSRGIAR